MGSLQITARKNGPSRRPAVERDVASPVAFARDRGPLAGSTSANGRQGGCTSFDGVKWQLLVNCTHMMPEEVYFSGMGRRLDLTDYRILPPWAGEGERVRLVGFALTCVVPVPVLVLWVGLVGLAVNTSSTDVAVTGGVAIFGIVVVVAQMSTTLWVRSLYRGDVVYLPGVRRARRIMTALSAPILIGAPLFAVIAIALGVGAVAVSFLVLLLVRLLGMITRLRHKKIEQFVMGGYEAAGCTPPYRWPGPSNS